MGGVRPFLGGDLEIGAFRAGPGQLGLPLRASFSVYCGERFCFGQRHKKTAASGPGPWFCPRLRCCRRLFMVGGLVMANGTRPPPATIHGALPRFRPMAGTISLNRHALAACVALRSLPLPYRIFFPLLNLCFSVGRSVSPMGFPVSCHTGRSRRPCPPYLRPCYQCR